MAPEAGKKQPFSGALFEICGVASAGPLLCITTARTDDFLAVTILSMAPHDSWTTSLPPRVAC